MKKTKKKYYAWIGQNATCGTPNPNTGYHSMYGTNYVFGDQKTRDQFVDDHYDPNYNNYAYKCTKRQLRDKNLGMSVRDFNEDLEQYAPTPYLDSDGRWC